MKKLLMSVTAYGSEYCGLFLNNQLQSLLDDTNLKAAKSLGYEIDFIIYTDLPSIQILSKHPNFVALNKLVNVELSTLKVEATEVMRYNALQEQLQDTVKEGLKRKAVISPLVADLVYAKNYLPLVLNKIDQGYDSVFMLPIRGVAEGMSEWLLKAKTALHSKALFEMTYAFMHPLWAACHWGNQQGSRMPYTLIFNSETGLIVRTFSTTPVVFTPYASMVGSEMIDRDLPGLCLNPYKPNNWDEVPVVGVEPLRCFYPPFKNKMNTPESIGKWARDHLHPSQHKHLDTPLYYPNQNTVMGPTLSAQFHESNRVVKIIKQTIGG